MVRRAGNACGAGRRTARWPWLFVWWPSSISARTCWHGCGRSGRRRRARGREAAAQVLEARVGARGRRGDERGLPAYLGAPRLGGRRGATTRPTEAARRPCRAVKVGAGGVSLPLWSPGFATLTPRPLGEGRRGSRWARSRPGCAAATRESCSSGILVAYSNSPSAGRRGPQRHPQHPLLGPGLEERLPGAAGSGRGSYSTPRPHLTSSGSGSAQTEGS